jgi:hypothetical protein
MRQNFVPRISFHAELEVVVLDVGRRAVPDLTCRHVIVEFFAAGECVPQRGQDVVWPLKNFRDWIDDPFVVTRLMPLHRGSDRCHDVHRAALFREKNLNARAGRLCRFNEDKFVLVRNDHRVIGFVDCNRVTWQSHFLSELRQ